MRYTHEQLKVRMHAASRSESEKLNNAEKLVKDAIKGSKYNDIVDVFGKGSYKNDTNIRLNSDMDICVCYTPMFKYEIPLGDTPQQHNIIEGSFPFSFAQYKEDLSAIMVQKFGKENVIIKNKCIHVAENTYHSEIDVVPAWYERQYKSSIYKNAYVQGIVLWADDGARVLNYPIQHYNNGVQKNEETKRRYKRLVRILKNLKVEMENADVYCNKHITSFLIECLAYNMPNEQFLSEADSYDWNTIVKNFIVFVWNGTKEDQNDWQSWTEVSEQLPLMVGHKWNREDVHQFTCKLWNYLQYE